MSKKTTTKKPRAIVTGTDLMEAAKNADWQQVVMNGGPPCFHYEKDRKRFCLRAQRWDGHYSWRNNPAIHKYVPLEQQLENMWGGIYD